MKPSIGYQAYHPHNGEEPSIVVEVDERKNIMRVRRNNKVSFWISTKGWTFKAASKDKDNDEGLHE